MNNVHATRKFKKKPVVIEAMRWLPSAEKDIINWIFEYGGKSTYYCEDTAACARDEHTIRISTLEGNMDAALGDWIIRGIQGEFYPCKPDIFDATYEEVTD